MRKRVSLTRGIELSALVARTGATPLEFRPFCAAIVSESEVAEEWRNSVAKWLLRSGCLYAIAWGTDCEPWHDAVDWANLEEFNFGEIPDDRLVMTTWHDGKPLSDALFFAGQCASHPTVELEQTIILQISAAATENALLAAYASSQIIDDD